MNKEPIGIRSIGIYRPPGVESAAYIAEQTGIPERVLVEKFGLRQKCRATADEHVSEMGRKAALDALERANLSPLDIDLVLFHGSQYKDYQPWSAACRIQELVGCRRASSFEIYSLCAGAPVALRTALALLRTESNLRRVLLVAATREGDLIDYTNARTRFLYNIGDGAAAIVLEKGWAENQLLGTAMRSDGGFSLDVIVPPGASALEVPDPAGMKDRLDPISMPNFLGVVDDALAAAGLGRPQVGFLAATHMKRSMHQALLDALGLTWEQSYYLEDWGHLQSADQYIALREGAQHGALRPGQVAVLAAAGIGYTWSAAIVKWGS